MNKKVKLIVDIVLFIVVIGGLSLKMKQPSYQYATLTIYGKQEKPIQYSIHNQDKIDLLVKTLNQSIHFQNAQKDYEKTKGGPPGKTPDACLLLFFLYLRG